MYQSTFQKLTTEEVLATTTLDDIIVAGGTITLVCTPRFVQYVECSTHIERLIRQSKVQAYSSKSPFGGKEITLILGKDKASLLVFKIFIEPKLSREEVNSFVKEVHICDSEPDCVLELDGDTTEELS